MQMAIIKKDLRHITSNKRMFSALLIVPVIMTVIIPSIFVLTIGSFVMPSISWLIMMLLVSPAVSVIAIALIVRDSAKAQTSEESQQRSVFLILPIALLLVSQFTGILMVNTLMLLGIGVVLAVIALLMLKGSSGNFQYETLLR